MMSDFDFIGNLDQFSLVEAPDVIAHREVQFLTQGIQHMDFEIPNVPEPGKFVTRMRESAQAPRLCDFKKGTTTLAFIYDGGIVVAADSRASRGTSIGSSTVKKVIEINNYLLGTMAGGAADCSFWERHLSRLARLYELRNRERLSVAAASNLLANIFFGYRGYGLSAGTMIAGWDTKAPQPGPKLYFVDNEGTRLKNDVFSCGSGSSFAYGVLDTEYKKDLTYDQAIELGRRAIYHATHRDGGSGGTVLLYHIDADGWKKVINHEDVNELHYKYAAEKGMEGDDL